MKRPVLFVRKVERYLAQRLGRRIAHLNYKSGTVCFTFDDVWQSACTTGAEILDKYRVNGTFYICGGLTGKKGYHTEADLRRLAGAGHELGCHGFGHHSYQSISQTEILADLQKNGVFFEKLGFVAPQHFAFPFGHVSPTAKRVTAYKFASVRGIRPGINHTVVDLALLKAFPLYQHLWTETALAKALEENAKCCGLLIFFTHRVLNDPGEFDCSVGLFDSAVRLAVLSGNKVVPMRDALPVHVNQTYRRVVINN